MELITPHFWFIEKAEEAARFYVSIFPDSRIDRVTALPAESPSGPPGSVQIVDFTLAGQRFACFSAGRQDVFNTTVSFVVNCDTQDEVDRYWNALLDGGQPQACGWLQDRHGVSWQITPTVLKDMIADPDRAKARRAAEAMLQMVKLDIATLRRAFDGD